VGRLEEDAVYFRTCRLVQWRLGVRNSYIRAYDSAS